MKQKKKKGALQKMARWMDLPEFALGRGESIEVLGGNTVRIEGAGGIHTYEPEIVKIAMKGYRVALRGRGFILAQFADGVLQISGKIESICWEVD